MPPKKDAFADLFSSASKTSQPPSLNSSLNNLSLQDNRPKPQSASVWSNLDILSPTTGQSPQNSKSTTPAPRQGADLDPFSIFDTQSPGSASSSSNVSAIPSRHNSSISRPENHHPPNNGGSLLDDDFTDAFEAPSPPVAQTAPKSAVSHSEPVAPVPERPTGSKSEKSTSRPQRSQSAANMDERDTVLAGLVDIGFPIEVANQAIDQVGPDVQACVNFIMSGGQSRESASRTSSRGSRKNSASPPDLGASFQEVSTDLLKKASWFLNKSRNTVLKNINQFQQGQERNSGNSMPAWMKNQEKYKARREDTDEEEENFNLEEIQRIMKQQKQRERERQRERMESLGKSSKARDSKESPRPSDSSSSGRSATSAPKLPTRPASTPTASKPVVTPEPPAPKGHATSHSDRSTPVQQEVDLLGLGSSQPLTRAQMFKQGGAEPETYVSPSRRRPAQAAKARVATAEVLNAFQQSDFETFKARATESYTQGDYGDALTAYTRCLEALPPKHELRIVISSNLAITQIKLGNYKTAKQHCDEGIALVGENIDDTDWIINEKAIKYWYVRLLMRKAESLEMLENFSDSLDCYVELITKHGVTDKKVMDAKRRVGNIVNPPKPRAKPQPKRQVAAPIANTEQVQKIKEQHNKEKLQDEMKFKLHDQVHDKITAWAHGKEDNLRSLLMSLDEVIPARLGFAFLQKKITISDLMLTKKVKINYMKVISSIHPDKLSKLELEDQMICQAVFVALNKAWDAFKEQNGIN